MLAKNLGTHLVWCQPIISSLARFQKFLVTCQNFGYNDQFLGMNQMIAKSFWHALILACQKLVANQAGSISTSYKNSLYQTPYHYPLEQDHPSISSTNFFFVNVGMQPPQYFYFQFHLKILFEKSRCNTPVSPSISISTSFKFHLKILFKKSHSKRGGHHLV